MWETAETKEDIIFLTNQFQLIRNHRQSKIRQKVAFVSSEYKKFCESRNIKIQYCPPRMHTGNGTVERAIQTIKNLLLAKMENGNNLTESVKRALKVMRFTIHTGLKTTPVEIHHGREPKTELKNIIKERKSFSSDWSELSILAPNKSKISIYVRRDYEWEITNHLVIACTKIEERQLASETKLPKKKKKLLVRCSFNLFEKRHNRKSLEGRLQPKIQTALCGTANTVKTDTGKVIHRRLISAPLFQGNKRHRRETVTAISAEITPRNRHCLRGLDGKYGKWDEILRYILNGKLRIVQNQKTHRDRFGRLGGWWRWTRKDTGWNRKRERERERERDGRYEPIWTDPEIDSQINTDGEIPQGEHSKPNIWQSNRNINIPNGYGSVPYQGNSYMWLKHCRYSTNLELHKRHPTTTVGAGAETRGRSPWRHDTFDIKLCYITLCFVTKLNKRISKKLFQKTVLFQKSTIQQQQCAPAFVGLPSISGHLVRPTSLNFIPSSHNL